MKKRLFSLVLAVLLVLASVPLASFADDVEVDINTQYVTQFTVDTVAVGNDDETVQVNINVDVNSGFAGMSYQLIYDAEALSLEQQPVLGNIEGFEFVPGPIGNGKHTGQLFSALNVNETGVLLTYTFNISPNATTGTHEVRLITSGKAETENVTLDLEVFDEDFNAVVNTSKSGGVSVPGYTVTYNANGGSGAPAAQIKDKNGSVIISSTLPVRKDYDFLGWATSSSSKVVEYRAGDTYSANADVVLYAVWKKQEIVAGSIDISAATVEGKAGDNVEVAISLANHPGVSGLDFDVVFDNTKLSYVSARLADPPTFENPDEAPAFTLNKFMFTPPAAANVTNKARIGLVANTENLVGDGAVVIITFKVLDEARDGFAEISIVPTEAFCLYGPNMDDATLTTNVTNGGVEISSGIVGDLNEDGKVNQQDRSILARHLANWDGYEADTFDYDAADVNEDGKVNQQDRTILARHLADWEGYETLPYKA